MRLILFCYLLLNFPLAFAVDTLTAVRDIPVFAAPNPQAKPVIYLKAGESFELAEPNGDFRRIRLKRGGRWRSGYVRKIDAEEIGERFATFERKWGVGGGGQFTHLSQTGRTFETEDQVQYATSAYISQTIAPALTLQLSDENFWRLSLAYKTTHYKAQAVTNVGGGSQKPIEINHRLISGLIQKAYNPLPWKFIYAGAGLELAKALAVEVQLDGNVLSTTDQEKPIYIGIQGFAGLQFFLLDRLSVAGESRLEVIPNQSPMIYQYEFSACLLFWM